MLALSPAITWLIAVIPLGTAGSDRVASAGDRFGPQPLGMSVTGHKIGTAVVARLVSVAPVQDAPPDIPRGIKGCKGAAVVADALGAGATRKAINGGGVDKPIAGIRPITGGRAFRLRRVREGRERGGVIRDFKEQDGVCGGCHDRIGRSEVDRLVRLSSFAGHCQPRDVGVYAIRIGVSHCTPGICVTRSAVIRAPENVFIFHIGVGLMHPAISVAGERLLVILHILQQSHAKLTFT